MAWDSSVRSPACRRYLLWTSQPARGENWEITLHFAAGIIAQNPVRLKSPGKRFTFPESRLYTCTDSFSKDRTRRGPAIEEARLRAVLEQLERGDLSVEDVVSRLRNLPYEDLDFAKVDHHRAIRQGFPEVIFGQGKTPEHIASISAAVLTRSDRLLVTRASQDAYETTKARIDDATYDAMARCIVVDRREERRGSAGRRGAVRRHVRPSGRDRSGDYGGVDGMPGGENLGCRGSRTSPASRPSAQAERVSRACGGGGHGGRAAVRRGRSGGYSHHRRADQRGGTARVSAAWRLCWVC